MLSAPALIFALGPSISLPILDGGRNQANLLMSQAALSEVQANFQLRVLTALREVEDALGELQHRRTILSAQQRSSEAATRAARVARLRYDQGAASYLEVTDTERTELAARRAMTQTRQAQWTATVQLIKALGGGWSG
jgi:multidrug efflux system outer membrane protein